MAEEKQEKGKSRAWILILVVIIALGLAVGGYFWLSQEKPGPVEKVTFGSSASHKIVGVFVAQNQGYFKESGIDLEIKEFDSGKASFLAMLEGEEVDISAMADTPLVFESFDRDDFYVLAGIYTSYDDKVIARRDKGINSVANLRGKRVGVTLGTSAHFLLNSLLTHNEILVSEVELVNLKPADLVPALEADRVDAISAWEPIPLQAEQVLQDNAIKFLNEEIYRKIFYLAVKKNFATNHPEALRRFLHALDKANVFIRANEAQSQAMVAREVKVDQKTVAKFWQEGEFGLFLEQSMLVTLEDQARWAIENNLTEATEVPNYLDYIYIDALEEIKPEAVTIIR